MTLESLLVTDLVKYFDSQNYKNFRGIKAPTESTKQFSFDLMDKTEPFIVEENSGSVTYKNPEEKTVFVTNYEEFIKTLPKNLQNGKKRLLSKRMHFSEMSTITTMFWHGITMIVQTRMFLAL